MGKPSLPQNMSLNIEDQKTFSKKVKTLKDKPTAKPGTGVVFLKHIPHGFFEPQMWAYFTQFGRVKRLRISRSKKTGRIKGYGYIEFADDAVAKIVAETMNNYLMFHKLLKCEYVPQEKLHQDTFKGANRIFSKPHSSMICRERHNATRSQKKEAKNARKRKNHLKKSLSKLAEMGVEYQLPLNDESLEARGGKVSDKPVASEPVAEAVADATVAGDDDGGGEDDDEASETEVFSYDDEASGDSDSGDDLDFDAIFGTAKSKTAKPAAKSSKSSKAPGKKNPPKPAKAPVKRKTTSQKKQSLAKKRR